MIDGDWIRGVKVCMYAWTASIYGLVMIPMSYSYLNPWCLPCSGHLCESFDMYSDDIQEIQQKAHSHPSFLPTKAHQLISSPPCPPLPNEK